MLALRQPTLAARGPEKLQIKFACAAVVFVVERVHFGVKIFHSFIHMLARRPRSTRSPAL